jgi:hypothetical protein
MAFIPREWGLKAHSGICHAIAASSAEPLEAG